MWIERLTACQTTQALELAARFAEQRHLVLAENLANLDTPGYLTKELDPAAFQASLREALEQARPKGVLELRGNPQFSTDKGGRLQVRPALSSANVLFHDGTNARLERLLADVAQNSLSYEMAVSLLRGRFQTLLRAIRGRIE